MVVLATVIQCYSTQALDLITELLHSHPEFFEGVLKKKECVSSRFFKTNSILRTFSHHMTKED